MIPRLRTPCALAVASLLLAAPAARADGPGAPVSDPPSPHVGSGLAGRPAGEGRERPGRPQEPSGPAPSGPAPARLSDPPSTGSPAPHPSATRGGTGTSTAPRATGTRESGSATAGTAEDAGRPPGDRRVASGRTHEPPRPSVATLGAGIMLLGLGLAFLALRLRRR
ncbi:hypothetical protein AB0910_20055 [Streptomyces sp. NPDC047002]|uniref:hypothetical protein n=1 Tax=Streptomyces sp. NPDC047002 TaxID=3155475 RepID=UPI0034528AB1